MTPLPGKEPSSSRPCPPINPAVWTPRPLILLLLVIIILVASIPARLPHQQLHCLVLIQSLLLLKLSDLPLIMLRSEASTETTLLGALQQTCVKKILPGVACPPVENHREEPSRWAFAIPRKDDTPEV